MNQLPRNISSLEVAEMVGREHNDMLKDLRRILSQLGEGTFPQSYFIESSYTNSQNKELPCFLLTKKGCELYGTRMTGEKGTQFAIKYIERFNEMEQHIQQQIPADPVELALQTALKTHRSLKNLETDVNYLKGSMRIDGVQQKAIQSAAKKKAMEALGGFETKAYKDLSSKVFRAIWKEFNTYFQLPRYGELPKSKYEDALYFISKWRISATLDIEIEACNKQEKFHLV